MSLGTSPCTPCCPTPQTVNVPGTPGSDGGDGINGVNAFTLTTTNTTVPSVGGSVTIAVANSTWMVVGQILILNGPANFIVTAIPSTTSVTCTFLNFPGDIAVASTILAGATVSPAGLYGGGSMRYVSTGSDYSATIANDLIEITGATKTVTLPTAVGNTGKVFTVKLTANSTGTVACSGGQNIDGSATYSLSAQYKYVQVASNGANWLIIGKN